MLYILFHVTQQKGGGVFKIIKIIIIEFPPPLLFFDLQNVAVLSREVYSKGKSNPSPANSLHCSYLLVMCRDLQRA